MTSSKAPDPKVVRDAVAKVAGWLDDFESDSPTRDQLATAVRATLAALRAEAPGQTVEVRVPPFGAVQCLDGPKHTRGTPPNVVQTNARTWLLLATGRAELETAAAGWEVEISGTRAAEVAAHLPLVRV